MPEPVLRVENLIKRYGDVEAVRGVSFSVSEGEVFGLLGPNGAGKTSTIEILEGLRNADGGTAVVCGYDPGKQADALKHEIGAALQSTALPDKMRVMEALKLFASFYKRHRGPDELLKRFGLEEKRNAFYSQLSGGQKQRLALAIALINDPKVVFLDEPTAGLDPAQIRETRKLMRELGQVHTMLLSTHILSEVEATCDSVIVIYQGQVVEDGSLTAVRTRHKDKPLEDIFVQLTGQEGI